MNHNDQSYFDRLVEMLRSNSGKSGHSGFSGCSGVSGISGYSGYSNGSMIPTTVPYHLGGTAISGFSGFSGSPYEKSKFEDDDIVKAFLAGYMLHSFDESPSEQIKAQAREYVEKIKKL